MHGFESIEAEGQINTGGGLPNQPWKWMDTRKKRDAIPPTKQEEGRGKKET